MAKDKSVEKGSAAAAKAKEGLAADGTSEPVAGRGRPAGSTKGKQKQEAAIQEIFSDETVGMIVALPFDLAEAATGEEVFALDPNESAYLTKTGKVCAQSFGGYDPKWIALSLFSIGLLKISATKYLAYKMLLANKKKALNGDGKKEG